MKHLKGAQSVAPRAGSCRQQKATPLVEFQVSVFKNPETPGYTCCVPEPFLSLVAGSTVQEVQEAVEECVADFIELYKQGGHKIPAAPKAPARQFLNKQDGFQQLLTVRLPGILYSCQF